jgi:hypothetical protein
MSTIIEEGFDPPTSVSRLVSLIAVPAIALGVMAALAMWDDTPHKPATWAVAEVAVSVTPAAPLPAHQGTYTLYITGSADDVQRVADLATNDPLLDWYAYLSTPAEEASLMQKKDEADWFRYASGLPPIRVVDLRPASAESTLAHIDQP